MMKSIYLRIRSLVTLAICIAPVVASTGYAETKQQTQASDRESEQLALLKSDAPASERALACKRLAVYGTPNSVPMLAQLLSDPQLASWSRIALEAIPGKESDQALRDAIGSLEGKLLVGVINSIGVRGDRQATTMLIPLLQSEELEVGVATAVALGKIGGMKAVSALNAALASAPEPIRSAAAEGAILYAEQLLIAGKSTEAAAIYDNVRSANVATTRQHEATRGAVLAHGDAGLPLLAELFAASERDRFRLGLSTARECQAAGVIELLRAALENAAPDRSALIVTALADRPEPERIPIIRKIAHSSAKPARVAAINSLAQIGDASCLDVLVGIALESDAELAALASHALATIPDPDVDREIVGLTEDPTAPAYQLGIELIGQRRIDAINQVMAALDNSDANLRKTALAAMGEIVDAAHLPVLLDRVVNPDYADDRPDGLRALHAASVRMPDREACAASLIRAMQQTELIELQGKLLDIIGAVGGDTALRAVGEAANGDSDLLRDVGSRLLGKWPTTAAAAPLLQLAVDESAGKYQRRGLRGYIRIARQLPMTATERAGMCERAWEAAKRIEEKEMILVVLERYPSEEGLKLAQAASHEPGLEQKALQIAASIRKQLKRR